MLEPELLGKSKNGANIYGIQYTGNNADEVIATLEDAGAQVTQQEVTENGSLWMMLIDKRGYVYNSYQPGEWFVWTKGGCLFSNLTEKQVHDIRRDYAIECGGKALSAFYTECVDSCYEKLHKMLHTDHDCAETLSALLSDVPTNNVPANIIDWCLSVQRSIDCAEEYLADIRELISEYQDVALIMTEHV